MAIDPAGRRGRDYRGREREDAPEEGESRYAKDPEVEDELLAKRMEEFRDWDDATVDNRENQERARDYYDCKQWEADRVDELNDRDQPIITKNRIAPKINFILGEEMDSRVDPRAFPRTNHHDQDGEAVSDALRYQADADDFDGKRSEVAGDLFIEGGPAGGVFSGSRETGDIELTQIPWDRIFFDPHSRKFDFSDARYTGIVVWMWRDELEELYPEKKDLIASTWDLMSGSSTDDRPQRWWSKGDERARVFETYYREPKRDKRGRVKWCWYRCVWTAGGILENDRCNFVDDKGREWNPMWLVRAYRSREGDLYGPVENMISPQDEINMRSSKALHLIHTQRVIAEQGAIQSPEEFQQQAMRPDGVMEVQPGRLSDRSIEIVPNTDLAMAQVSMLQDAKAEIDAVGPSGQLVGTDPRIQSGRALLARQQAGSKEMKPIFDHLRRWTIGAYRRYWWLIRMFWGAQKWFRVQDEETETGYRFVALNRRMTRAQRIEELVEERGHSPEDAIRHVLGPYGTRLLRMAREELQQAQAQAQQRGMQAPQVDPIKLVLQSPSAQEEFTSNDVAQLDVDLVLDATPDSIIIQHEQYQDLIQLISSMPHLAQQKPELVKMLIEASDLRQKRRLLKILDPPQPDPQQQAMQQQMQALQQQMLQAQLATAQATIQKLQAEAAKAAADAQVGIPSKAQHSQAQAALAAAKAQAVPHEARLTDAQTAKAVADAAATTAGAMAPAGAQQP